jgi:hypothetical protein
VPSAQPVQRGSSRWIFPVAALFLIGSAYVGYRIGVRQSHTAASSISTSPVAINLAQADGRSANKASPSDKTTEDQLSRTAELQHQLEAKQLELSKLHDQKSQLEAKLTARTADLDREARSRAAVDMQLAQSQTDAQSLREQLGRVASQGSQDAGQSQTLQAQVNALNTSLEAKDQEIARKEELLQHDRDIRDLVGARDLYIAEIYDVGKTGETQKPFGRVFYTKGKSLVFYAYDLDQQPGMKLANTFQAWGRRGPGSQHDVDLGIFYQDDQNKKRWVLKFDDPMALAQIDAVFVTVEPHGKSSKPSGKPLLFTYLRMTPNHP